MSVFNKLNFQNSKQKTLDQKVKEYLNKGGVVTEVKGYEYKALPAVPYHFKETQYGHK